MTTFIVDHGLPKLSTTTYSREYGYERHVQISQQKEKVVVLHCVPLVCTWMDDELMVSIIDAVMRGELVVNRAALMQYACCPESHL